MTGAHLKMGTSALPWWLERLEFVLAEQRPPTSHLPMTAQSMSQLCLQCLLVNLCESREEAAVHAAASQQLEHTCTLDQANAPANVCGLKSKVAHAC